MGAKPAKEKAALVFDVKVEVSREDFYRCYTDANIVLMDACIQQFYNLDGGSRYISRNFRNLALFFLSPLCRTYEFNECGAPTTLFSSGVNGAVGGAAGC
jgi:hypothetical protein